MRTEECTVRRARAAAELEQHEGRQDAPRVANSLTFGMNLLRTQMFERIHNDVEKRIGFDSMLLPVAADKSELKTKVEIEIYQIAECAVEVHERNYVRDSRKWYCDWLTRLRFGESPPALDQIASRLQRYVSLPAHEREILFGRVLAKVLPESVRAPLVLFRLFPLSVRIVAAIAFGDHFAAAELRNQQTFLLPAIGDCQDCHGRPLDNGEKCRRCGNPVWTFDWLTAIE